MSRGKIKSNDYNMREKKLFLKNFLVNYYFFEIAKIHFYCLFNIKK